MEDEAAEVGGVALEEGEEATQGSVHGRTRTRRETLIITENGDMTRRWRVEEGYQLHHNVSCDGWVVQIVEIDYLHAHLSAKYIFLDIAASSR